MVWALHLSSSAPGFPSATCVVAHWRQRRRRVGNLRPHGKKPASPGSGGGGEPSENAVLRLAWYGSELLGIAASFLRPSPPAIADDEGREMVGEEGAGPAGRTQVVEAIKEDFQRSYFVTDVVFGYKKPTVVRIGNACEGIGTMGLLSKPGNLTLNAYEEDCEFADPAGSFKGLDRFKRNCSNFGLLLVKSKMKLTKWEDFEDKGVGHWRFSCIMSFPWRPILSATGYTEYYFNADSGKVFRHVEHWNVPKMALLKQIFRPTRWVWSDKRAS